MLPIGVMPRKYWEISIITERMNDIARAVGEYTDADEEIPEEWLEEWYQLMKRKHFLEKGEI